VGRQAATGAEAGSDTWLTPPALLEALGPFDLDPCCPPVMPWRTATAMWSHVASVVDNTTKCDGLLAAWPRRCRVFVNPPYSRPLAWVEKMAAHGDGVLLVPGTSPETRWGQQVLATADLLLYLTPRLKFWSAAGVEAPGAWQPNLLAAYGKRYVSALRRLPSLGFNGVLLVRDGG
jgi:hypothetical protein